MNDAHCYPGTDVFNCLKKDIAGEIWQCLGEYEFIRNSKLLQKYCGNIHAFTSTELLLLFLSVEFVFFIIATSKCSLSEMTVSILTVGSR